MTPTNSHGSDQVSMRSRRASNALGVGSATRLPDTAAISSPSGCQVGGGQVVVRMRTGALVEARADRGDQREIEAARAGRVLCQPGVLRCEGEAERRREVAFEHR